MNPPESDGLAWRVSSYTGGQGNCVELARTPAEVHVRDTKNRPGGMLTFGADQWRAFRTHGLH